MILFLDNEKRIIAVNTTEREDLTAVEFDDTAMDFPFVGWSDTRICCYRIDYSTDEEQGNHITMMTPYVPTHMMSALENLEKHDAELDMMDGMLMDYTSDLLYEICLLQLGITEEDM